MKSLQVLEAKSDAPKSPAEVHADRASTKMQTNKTLLQFKHTCDARCVVRALCGELGSQVRHPAIGTSMLLFLVSSSAVNSSAQCHVVDKSLGGVTYCRANYVFYCLSRIFHYRKSFVNLDRSLHHTPGSRSTSETGSFEWHSRQLGPKGDVVSVKEPRRLSSLHSGRTIRVQESKLISNARGI